MSADNVENVLSEIEDGAIDESHLNDGKPIVGLRTPVADESAELREEVERSEGCTMTRCGEDLLDHVIRRRFVRAVLSIRSADRGLSRRVRAVARAPLAHVVASASEAPGCALRHRRFSTQ